MHFASLYRLRATIAHILNLGRKIQTGLVAFAVICTIAAPMAAQSALIVRNDLGGSVEKRLTMITALRLEGRRVEIRGNCASACTMYLGLPNACVSRASRLGFHGPQSQFYGISLPPQEFEYWSRVMASNYPDKIARWFMADARETTLGLITISGAQAIKMGAHAC